MYWKVYMQSPTVWFKHITNRATIAFWLMTGFTITPLEKQSIQSIWNHFMVEPLCFMWDWISTESLIELNKQTFSFQVHCELRSRACQYSWRCIRNIITQMRTKSWSGSAYRIRIWSIFWTQNFCPDDSSTSMKTVNASSESPSWAYSKQISTKYFKKSPSIE